MVRDAGQRGEARDAKDGGAKELRCAGEEAQLVEVVVAEVVPGRTPLPVPRWCIGAGELGPPDEVVLVLVVVAAEVSLCGELEMGVLVGGVLLVDELFDGPAEAASVVGVDGLEDEEQGAGFKEENGADEGGYAAAPVALAFEFRRGAFDGQPGKEAL